MKKYEPEAALRSIAEACEDRGQTHESADRTLDHVYMLACMALHVISEKKES